MNDNSLLLKVLWGFSPVFLSFGPILLWMGSSGDSTATGVLGTTMLMLGLLSLHWKVRILCTKLNAPE